MGGSVFVNIHGQILGDNLQRPLEQALPDFYESKAIHDFLVWCTVA